MYFINTIKLLVNGKGLHEVMLLFNSLKWQNVLYGWSVQEYTNYGGRCVFNFPMMLHYGMCLI